MSSLMLSGISAASIQASGPENGEGAAQLVAARAAQLVAAGAALSAENAELRIRVADLEAELAKANRQLNFTSMAAAAGNEELVRWLIQEQGPVTDGAMMGMAARGGNLDLVRWLRSEGCDWSAWACRCAAEAGQLRILKWLRAEGCPWDAMTCYAAVNKGHVETLRWARANGAPWTASIRDWAAAKLGYTDNFGNLVDSFGNPVQL